MTSISAGVSRRSLILGGAGLAGSAGLAGCGRDRGKADGPSPGRRASGRFASDHMGGASIGWSAAYPPGAEPGTRMRMILSLHGRGASHTTTFATLGLDRVLAQVPGIERDPVALVSVDGGRDSYWHARASGIDPPAMIVGDLLPRLADRGLDTGAIGLYGWSMGGYGSLLFTHLHRDRVAAVAVASPALFRSAGASAAGAFDDAEDYARHDVFGHPGWAAGVPLMIACGRSDPFFSADVDFARRVSPPPVTDFGPGSHEPAYWRRRAPRMLGFLHRQLTG